MLKKQFPHLKLLSVGGEKERDLSICHLWKWFVYMEREVKTTLLLRVSTTNIYIQEQGWRRAQCCNTDNHCLMLLQVLNLSYSMAILNSCQLAKIIIK